jgi:hypothetical protein
MLITASSPATVDPAAIPAVAPTVTMAPEAMSAPVEGTTSVSPFWTKLVMFNILCGKPRFVFF